MRFLLPNLKVVVAVASPIAFEPLNGTDLLTTSIQTAKQFATQSGLQTTVAVAAKPELTNQIRPSFAGEVIECDPTNPASFAKALENSTEFEIVAVHDAQRPLTNVAQFQRVVNALAGNCDAARPATAFTETLKVVNAASELTKTIDRTKVRRISTPEVIRKSAIDFAGTESTWFLPLKVGAKTIEVEADPESLRINSSDEIAMAESFLVWQQRISR
jgi:2-C-methyl-D-erythritol 4-phosphate cytidylyltransferase